MWNVIIYNFEFNCLTKMDNNQDLKSYLPTYDVIVTDVIVTNWAKRRLWQMLMPCFVMADVNAVMFILTDVIANVALWAIMPICLWKMLYPLLFYGWCYCHSGRWNSHLYKGWCYCPIYDWWNSQLWQLVINMWQMV